MNYVHQTYMKYRCDIIIVRQKCGIYQQKNTILSSVWNIIIIYSTNCTVRRRLFQQTPQTKLPDLCKNYGIIL